MSYCSLALQREREKSDLNRSRMCIVDVDLPISCSIVMRKVVKSLVRTQEVCELPIVVEKRGPRVNVRSWSKVDCLANFCVFLSNSHWNSFMSKHNVDFVRAS